MNKAKSNISIKSTVCHMGGYMFFAIGFAGIFLPLLPTTIFWILAVWSFAKVHPEMVSKIYNWPHVGRIVKDFVTKGIISNKSKKIASAGIILIGGLSIGLTDLHLNLSLFIALILASVIFYITTRPAS